MKTAITLLAVLALTFSEASAQTIPNASFENWSLILDQYFTPDGWATNASDLSPAFYESPGQSGNLALSLRNYRFARTKFHFTQYPFTISAYAKGPVMANDSVRIRVFVYSGNTVVTNGEWLNTTTIPSWAPINISVSDNLTAVPDSVEILITGGTSWETILSVDNFSISPIAGVHEDDKTRSFCVSPNPFTESISIKTNSAGPLNFSLYDVAGKLVLEQSDVENNTIPAQHIPHGIYIYEARDKYGFYVRGKLVKN